MEIIIQVPEDLGEELQHYNDHLVEILEYGLQGFKLKDRQPYADEQAVLSFLAGQPDPQAVLALTPSHHLQTRISALLKLNKTRPLSSSEESELNRYRLLEQLVRLAKAQATQKLNAPS